MGTTFVDLMARLRAGDESAAERLCQEYGPYLRAAVRRHLHPGLRTRYDSLDFTQDVWASVLALSPDRLTFDSPQALRGFLQSVALHKVTDAFRQRFQSQKNDIHREVFATADQSHPASEVPATVATPSQWVIAEETWDRLLSSVPHGHRPVVERLREGYTTQEIAELTGVSLSTVNRVVRRLKDLIEIPEADLS